LTAARPAARRPRAGLDAGAGARVALLQAHHLELLLAAEDGFEELDLNEFLTIVGVEFIGVRWI
jgi:hypothetical protein